MSSLFALAILFASRPAQDAKDPDDLLNKLSKDLQAAIKNSPKDADTRGKLTAAAKAVFDKEITSAVPKTAKPIWDWQTHYLELLITADKKFALEAHKNERSTWLAACRSAFTRQILEYKESSLGDDEQPRVDKVFSDFYEAVDKAKGAYTTDGSLDLRTAAFGGARDIFGKLLTKARKPGRDAQKWYEDTLAKIDQEYPLTNDKQRKWNSEPNQILKAGAKAAFDQAIKAK